MPISAANPLRVVFDGYEAYTTQRVGSNVFAFELLCALEKSTRTRDDIEVTVVLPGVPLEDFPAPRAGWQYARPTSTWLWSQWSLPRYLYQNKDMYDVLYTPSHYAPRLCPIPYISSVMDLGFLEFPKQFKLIDYLKLRYWTEYSVRSAHRVLCISEYTRMQVAQTYQVPQEKLFVAYPACGFKKILQSSATRRELLNTMGIKNAPFFLAVGTLQPRKNIIRMIDAFEKFTDITKIKAFGASGRSKVKTARFDAPVHLVLAGRPGWLSQPILQRIANSPLEKYIHVLGFVTEEQKTSLYTHALATLCLGLHEGFGIPALESQLYGCIPVIAEGSSLPEVAPEVGIRVNPYDISSITDGMWQAATLSAKRLSQKRTRMKKNLAFFSWHDSAQKLLEALESVQEETHER